MTYIPEDPKHKNMLIELLEELIREQKKTNYLLEEIADIKINDEDIDYDYDQ